MVSAGGNESTGGFYKRVPAFGDFEGFTDPSRYQTLPADWRVVIADIRGSTKAIAEGRYKDVNMMGAACITAVLNALKQFDPVLDVPYVFGGDGATFAVPDDAVEKVRHALIRTRARRGLDQAGLHPGAKRPAVFPAPDRRQGLRL